MTVFFFLYLLGTVGMTLIVVKGVIFQPVRQFIGEKADAARQQRERQAEKTGKLPPRSIIEFLSELISCTQCTGFWCGLFCGILMLTPDANVLLQLGKEDKLGQYVVLPVHYLLLWFCCGTAGSFAASLGDIVLEWVFYHKMVALRNLEKLDQESTEH
ncbi:MAG: DUF1360 domain-containing protein [Planctomycetaceae bacterium]|jgi:hypothetical protein|nr:DUF1360 domain-containing protein [Planctomycetaceae bacterium]